MLYHTRFLLGSTYASASFHYWTSSEGGSENGVDYDSFSDQFREQTPFEKWVDALHHHLLKVHPYDLEHGFDGDHGYEGPVLTVVSEIMDRGRDSGFLNGTEEKMDWFMKELYNDWETNGDSHLQLVELMVSYGVRVPCEFSWANNAASAGSVQLLEAIDARCHAEGSSLKELAEDKFNLNPIQYASLYGKTTVVDYLLQEGWYLDAQKPRCAHPSDHFYSILTAAMQRDMDTAVAMVTAAKADAGNEWKLDNIFQYCFAPRMLQADEKTPKGHLRVLNKDALRYAYTNAPSGLRENIDTFSLKKLTCPDQKTIVDLVTAHTLETAVPMADFLIDAGVPAARDGCIFARDFPLMHMAAKHGCLKLIKAGMRDYHVNMLHMESVWVPFEYLRNGLSMQHEAAQNGHTHVVEYLLKRGADVNIKGENPPDCHSNKEQTPLQLALYSGQYKTMEYLLQHGADPNETDKEGNTALLYIIKDVHPKDPETHNRNIQLLLKHGANLFAENKSGNTLLSEVRRKLKTRSRTDDERNLWTSAFRWVEDAFEKRLNPYAKPVPNPALRGLNPNTAAFVPSTHKKQKVCHAKSDMINVYKINPYAKPVPNPALRGLNPNTAAFVPSNEKANPHSELPSKL